MRAIIFTVLGLLLALPLTARGSGPAEVHIATGLKRDLGPSSYTYSPYYFRYTSPYYYRGGFLSPYVLPVPRPEVMPPRYSPLHRYERFDVRGFDDRVDQFGRRHFDGRPFDSHDRFDRGRVERFHRPHVEPRGGGERSFRGETNSRAGGGGARAGVSSRR